MWISGNRNIDSFMRVKEMSIKCPECGHEMSTDSRARCPRCGYEPPDIVKQIDILVWFGAFYLLFTP